MPMLANSRHELFAQALAAGKTADAAYQEADYKPNRQNAHRLTTKDDIVARVTELKGRVAKGVVITRQWVLERLVENANRAMQAEPVVDASGKPSGMYRYDGNVANRALELVGKELSMFIERKESGKPGDFDKLTADELRTSIAADLAALGREDLAMALKTERGEVGRKPH